MVVRQVQLTEELDRFLAEQVATGRFADENEALLVALKLLERTTAVDAKKLERLRALAAVGFEQLDRGEGVVIESAEQLREHIAKIGREAAEKIRREKGA